MLPIDIVLNAYCNGYFPMGDEGGEAGWYRPEHRAVMPFRNLHVARKLRRLVLKQPYDIRVDTAFDDVIAGCAENRIGQWITGDIQSLFAELHKAGFAHSIECWKGDELAGGIYGLAIGSAFCAESMFSRESNASKVALIHLCARLARGGFTLLDCQILNDHTQRLGAAEISGAAYLTLLQSAIQAPADFLLSESGTVNEHDLVETYLAKVNESLPVP